MHVLRSLPLVLGAVMLMALPGLAHGQAPSTPPAATGPKTSVFVFEPYTARGLNPDMKAIRTVDATCATGSQMDVNRPDAWACTAGTKTYDPCFASNDGTELACLDLPQVSDPSLSAASILNVVVAHPIVPLDQDQANTVGVQATPFLLELVDGEYCVPEPADIRYASLLIFGYCTNGYWFGPADTSKDLWLMPVLQSGSSPTFSQLVNIGILRVWY